MVLTTILTLMLEYFVFDPATRDSKESLWDRLVPLFPWILGVGFMILLLNLVVRKSARAVMARVGRWFKGLRLRSFVTTEKHRSNELAVLLDLENQSFDQGYEKRSAEVTAEREDARLKPPSFSVERRDDKNVGEFWLYNRGWKVGNVWLTAPEDEFIFDGDPPVWQGDFGDDLSGGSDGKVFYGLPTEKGLADGVNFTVEWSWRNLDRDSKPLRAEPSRLVTSCEESGFNRDALN